jgi:carboxylesterase
MSIVFSLSRGPSAGVVARLPEEIVLKGTLQKTIILIHGLTGTPNEMRHLAFYFHKRGYSVICPRLARHGEPLHALKYATWEEFYDSVRALFLKTLETGDKVYVAGLSMSALFVLLLAEEFGAKVSAGIGLAPTLFFDGWNVPWYHRLLPVVSYTPLKYHFFFKESSPYGIKNEKIRAMVHRYYSHADLGNLADISKYGYAFFPLSLFYQLRRLTRKVTPLLDRIDAPMLLIHPQEDDTASLKNSQFIFDRISSAVKKLVVLTDSYHVITADQEREKVAREMAEFLDSL